MKQKTSDTETTEAMLKALRDRYQRPEWAFMTEVPNGTGAKASRRADAVAYNLFPSKGNVMICFELKASKSDLQKELKDGTKSNAIGQFADYFFLVCPDGIIDDSILLPKTWGVLTYKNGKLRQTKKPEALDAAQMDKAFMAALLQSLLRENDYHINCINQTIGQIVQKRTREDLENYTKFETDRLKRIIKQQEEELKVVSAWRDAMQKCYARVFHKAVRDVEYDPLQRSYKSIDEIINDSNFVEDMAAFLHLRKDFSQDAMFTMNSISHHTKRLEESMIKMKQIFSLPEE